MGYANEQSGKAALFPTVVKHRCAATDRTTAEQFPGTLKMEVFYETDYNNKR